MHIVKMTKAHVSAVAKLHQKSIKTGLITWLGQNFRERLYWGMASTPYSSVLVYEDEQGRPLGFICCSSNTSKMYKSVLLRNFFPLILSAINKFVQPSVVKQIMISIRRPKTFMSGDFSEWELPEAEIVSIGVTPDVQGEGIGTKLIKAAFEHFRSIGHNRIRVWTTEDNERATAFYLKQGFKLLGTRNHHIGKINVFVINIDE
jgi:ribosomal protein S18 acetylase RimI-like enzyme